MRTRLARGKAGWEPEASAPGTVRLSALGMVMPHITVDHDNTAVELFYEDHGIGRPWCWYTAIRSTAAAGSGKSLRCWPQATV